MLIALRPEDLVTPAAFLLAAIILGYIFEKILLDRAEKFIDNSKLKNGSFFLRALHGVTFFSFLAAGVYFAILNLPLEEEMLIRIETGISVFLTVVITVMVSRLAVAFVDMHARREGKMARATSIFTNVTRLIVFVLGLLMILNTLGIQVTPMLTALGVGGIAVALGIQATLANLFAGLQIIAARQIRQGDFIELDTGIKGYVSDITWRNTSIRMLSNNMVIIPNSKLSDAVVTNYNQPTTLVGVSVDIAVSYDENLEKVERAALDVAKEVMSEVEGGVADFEPLIRFHTFGDFSIKGGVHMQGQDFVSQYLIKHEFIRRLHQRFQKEGIKIAYPRQIMYEVEVGVHT